MKLFTLSVLTMFLSFSLQGRADIPSLNAMMEKATADEANDLDQLFDQISVVPTKDAKTGKTLYKVTKVEKGSVYEHEGVKVGDLVAE